MFSSATFTSSRLKLKVLAFLSFLFLVIKAQSQVVINEVMFNPGTQGMLGTNDPSGWYYGSEYIEIYNTGCVPVDISGWMLGNNTQPLTGSRSGGSFSFPNGTIIQPKSHLVLGTRNSSSDPNSIDFKTEDFAPTTTPPSTGSSNPWNRYQNLAFPYFFQAGNPPSRPTYWVLPNFEGWIALYNNSGVPQDAIYWTGANDQNFITTAGGTQYFADRPTAPLSYTNADPTLPSVRQIFQSNPAIVRWFNRSVAVQNQTIQRVPDGGQWSTSTGTPSINHNVNGPNANCNGGVGNCFTPTAAITGFSYTSPLCAQGSSTPTPVTGFVPGGTYTAPAGVVIDPSTGVINLASSTPGTYTINYAVVATVCSGAGNSNTNITIQAPPNAGTSSNQTLCNNGSPVNLFSFLGGTPATTGTWTGPSSLTGGHLGTFNPSTQPAGVYTYTVTGAPCSPSTATVTITIDDCTCPLISNPSSAQSVCVGGNPGILSVNTSITGANTITFKYYTSVQTGNNMYTGGTLLGNVTPASGSASYDPGVLGGTGSFPNTAGTYYVYAILNPAPLSTACRPFQQIIVTVNATNTVTPASATPTLCISTAISPSITHTTTGATGIGTATGLPAGVTASWAGNTITISGTPTADGTFAYTIPLTGGCGAVNATGTITVTANNTVSAASSTPTLCINSPLTNITHTTTGAIGIGTPSGLPSGVTAIWTGNTITISGTPTVTGTFAYTIPLLGGCGTVSATGTITVTANNTVSAASSTPTLCIGTPLTNIIHTTTGATGIGTPVGLPAGVTASWSGNTITISGTPIASGTFDYQIPLTGGCGTIEANGTIIVSVANTVSPPSVVPTVCINTAMPAITYTTTGSITGISTPSGLPGGVSAVWNPSGNTLSITGTPNTAGVFNYSIPLVGGCGNINATGTITVTLNATLTLTSGNDIQSVCGTSNAIVPITYLLGSGATGVSQTGLPPGLTTSVVGNTVTVSGTPTSTVGSPFSFTLTTTGGTCGSVTQAGTITINSLPTIVLNTGNNTQTLCVNTPISNITYTLGGGATGATVSGLPAGVTASVSGNIVTITGSPTTAAGSPFNYTIVTSGGSCGTVSLNGTINVSTLPSISITSGSTTQSVCTNSAITNITYTLGGGATGATFNGLPPGVLGSVSGNTVTISGIPTSSTGSPFNYTVVTTGGGCGTANQSGTIIVNTLPVVILTTGSSTQSICVNRPINAITYTISGGATGAVVAGLPAGVTANFSGNTLTISGTPTASSNLPFNFTVTTTGGGCGTANVTGALTVNPIPVVSAGPDRQVEQGKTVVLNGTSSGSNNTILWTPPTGLSSTNTLTPVATITQTTTYTLTVTSGAGCTASDQVLVTLLKPIDVPNVFSPNGDGVHDRWVIRNIELYTNSVIEVFNRYGKKVFEKRAYTNASAWDGTFNGAPLPVGAYYYVIRLGTNKEPVGGSISIIR